MNNPLIELKVMGDILESDINGLAESALTEQFGRRMYVRALFALVEGMIYRMKQVCFSDELASTAVFSSAELALLHEESYDLDDRGRVLTKPSNLQLVKNIQFAFGAFSKYFGSNYTLKLDDTGWQSFLKAIKIRNRLTHPKFARDLTVSEEEFEIIKRASAWFEQSVKLALDDASKILESQTNLFQDATTRIQTFISEMSHKLSNNRGEREGESEQVTHNTLLTKNSEGSSK